MICCTGECVSQTAALVMRVRMGPVWNASGLMVLAAGIVDWMLVLCSKNNSNAHLNSRLLSGFGWGDFRPPAKGAGYL